MKATDIIRDPGKFEGEPVYVRDLWDATLDGGGDETIYDGETPCEVFVLSSVDRASYGLDSEDYAIVLWEDSNGFVHSRVMTEHTLNMFRSECESDDEG